jgi:cytidylate kinase
MIITIDGPVATGKSTIAKKLAASLGYIYFDTGAMYRALTYGVLKNKIDCTNTDQLKEYLNRFSYKIRSKFGEKYYYVDGEDVSQQIRGDEVTSNVSRVSALPVVREKLVSLQRELASGVNAVFEGRDMGTVVFPDARLKIFLTGRPEVRAQRRFDELKEKFPEEAANLTMEKVLEDLNKRDNYDSSRETSPLKQAEDAYLVDTSDLTPDEIVFKILEFKDAKARQK